MATVQCTSCGFAEPDGRPSDREVYLELCSSCTSEVEAADINELLSPGQPARDTSKFANTVGLRS